MQQVIDVCMHVDISLLFVSYIPYHVQVMFIDGRGAMAYVFQVVCVVGVSVDSIVSRIPVKSVEDARHSSMEEYTR